MLKKIFFGSCFFFLFVTIGKSQIKIDSVKFETIPNADSVRFINAENTFRFDSIVFGKIYLMYFEKDTLYALIKPTKEYFAPGWIENRTWAICQLDKDFNILKYKIYTGIYNVDDIAFFKNKVVFYYSDDDGSVLSSLSFNSDSVSKKAYNYTNHEGVSIFIQNKDTLSLLTNNWLRILKFDSSLNKISERLIKKPPIDVSAALLNKGKYYLLISDGVNKNDNSYPVFSKFDKNVNYLGSESFVRDTDFIINDAIVLNDSLNIGFSAKEIDIFKNSPKVIHKIIFSSKEENQHFNKAIKIDNDVYFLFEFGSEMYLLKFNLDNEKFEWKLKLYRSYRNGPGGNDGPFGMLVKNNFLLIYGAESNNDLSNVYPKLVKIKLDK